MSKPVIIRPNPGKLTPYGRGLVEWLKTHPRMMGGASLSDAYELKVLDHLTKKSALTAPDGYVALCTSAPTDASTGSTIVEASYTAPMRG